MANDGRETGKLAGALLSRPRVLGVMALLGIVLVTCSGFLLLDPDQGGGFQVLIEDAPEPSEVLRLSSLLCKEGIATRIEDGGQTLLVQRTHHEQAVRLVMEEGLNPMAAPAEDDFFGLGQGLEVSPEDSRRRVCRSREAELARTLALYPAVQFARVHLNLPEGRGFGKSEGAPTASVFLGLKTYRRLSGAQARAIRELVSHAVEGLTEESVVLADSRGTDYGLLIRQEAGRDLGATEERLRLLRSAERQAEDKILAHLHPLFGDRNVSVSVVTIFDQGEDTDGLRAPLVSGLPVRYRSLAVTLNTQSLSGQALTTSVAQTVRAAVLASLGAGDESLGFVRVWGAPFRHAATHEPPAVPARLASLDAGEPSSFGFVPPGASRPSDDAVVEQEEAAALVVGVASAGEARSRAPDHAPLQGGVALPVGILFLLAGTCGVITAVRAAPCPSTLAGASQEFDPVDLRTDSGVRRVAVSCWAEEDPDFAARILTRMLRSDA